MAVKVTKSNDSNQVSKSSNIAQHGNGMGIEVREGGHLLVFREASTRPIAIYVPGTWVSAEVTE